MSAKAKTQPTPELPELLARRDRRFEELGACRECIRGSMVETERSPFRYLSRSVEGRNKITYVRKKDVGAVRHGLAQYKRAKDLLWEIAELNVLILKAGGRPPAGAEERREGGR